MHRNRQQERVEIQVEEVGIKTARAQFVLIRTAAGLRRVLLSFSQIHEVKKNSVVVTPFIAKKEGLL